MLVARKPVKRQGKGKSAAAGLAMVSPAMVLFSIFGLWPILQSLWISLHEWEGIGPMKWVGLANFVRMPSDRIVSLAFVNNVLYSIGIVLVAVVPGLVIAVLLASTTRGRTLFQAIFFLPRLFTQVIVALVWSWLFNPVFGLVNLGFKAIGLPSFAIGWLGDPTWALFAVIVAAGWTYYGFCMVIFLAALQNTDPFLRDAALIDGASELRIFFSVVLPQIRDTVTMVVVYTMIDSFKVFDIIYLMTRGGPGDSTQIISTYMYREAFRHNHFGYAAAISLVLTLFVLGVSLFIIRAREKGEEK